MTVSSDRKGFVTQTGERYAPFGANYFRPNTGWAPQVWKRFDEAATRRDFAPKLNTVEDAMDSMSKAVADAGYKLRKNAVYAGRNALPKARR